MYISITILFTAAIFNFNFMLAKVVNMYRYNFKALVTDYQRILWLSL